MGDASTQFEIIDGSESVEVKTVIAYMEKGANSEIGGDGGNFSNFEKLNRRKAHG